MIMFRAFSFICLEWPLEWPSTWSRPFSTSFWILAGLKTTLSPCVVGLGKVVLMGCPLNLLVLQLWRFPIQSENSNERLAAKVNLEDVERMLLVSISVCIRICFNSTVNRRMMYYYYYYDSHRPMNSLQIRVSVGLCVRVWRLPVWDR